MFVRQYLHSKTRIDDSLLYRRQIKKDIASRRRELLDRIANEHIGPGKIIPLTLDHADKESLKAAVAEVSKLVRSSCEV